MSNLKRPILKNIYLSLKGKEPALNNFTLYNYFPIGLMIISKIDPTSCNRNYDIQDNKNYKNEEVEIKIKYINQQASDLFEIKENDSITKIHEQLKQFKQYDKTQIADETLDNILFSNNDNDEFYGSFKNQTTLIYVKYKVNNENLYICTDYYTEERKIIQNQLFQSLKFQYIATLFHELYNPINSLLFLVDMNNNEDEFKKDIIKSNIGEHNYLSELEESHLSVMTENYNEKSNFQDNGNILIKKEKKIEDLYRAKLISLHEKEKDICLLVNMIYIFLENLILYLRINLGVDSNEDKKDENEDFSFDIKEKKIINNKNEEEKNSENKENIQENNMEFNNTNHNIYSDHYLTYVNKNKKLNLEFLFYKHLNKFSYLFQFKGIQYCTDFSYLSDKYILTDETVFMDFLGQIYSFLYYVVPKSQGFELSYNLINENKMKIMFQKTNCIKKGRYRLRKSRKDNSCLIFEEKFKASSTVKTSQMTEEILHKLSEKLGIKLKIMEYEDQKEDIYLSIILPFFTDEVNDFVDPNINEFPNENYGRIPFLDEVTGRNILNENDKDYSNIDDIVKKKDKKDKINNKENSPNPSITLNKHLLNNCQNKPISYVVNKNYPILIEKVEENNCSEEEISSVKEEDGKEKENKNNLNTNQKKSNESCYRLSYSSSSPKKQSLCKLKSPMSVNNLSSIQKRNFKDVSTICLKELSPFLTQDINNISKDNQNVTKNNRKGNLLTLIHQKYSNIEKLKSRGVEILAENENGIEKNNKDNNSRCLSSMNSNEDNKRLKDKKSISVEIDSDDYIEFENDYDSLDFENDLNNHKNEENDNNCNKNNNHRRNNSVLLNLNYINTSGLYSSPKNNRININNTKENKSSNKTLNYNNANNDRLFVIPEINENALKDLTSLEIPKISKNSSPISLMKCDCDCKDILVVDDDEFICKTSKKILKSFKLEADFASDGQECLNKIKEKQDKNCNCPKNKYKLVLMDITMPKMDGIEAAKNIQKMIEEKQLYDTIKIIFISAHINLDLTSITSGIKCAIDYYAKPISGVKYRALLDKYYYSK